MQVVLLPHPAYHIGLWVGTIKCAHAVASESVISNHMMAPKLPKPDATMVSDPRQLFAFPTHSSFLFYHSSHFPHLLPLLLSNWTQATYSQDIPFTTYQAFSAEDFWIAHIRPANNKPKDNTTPHCTHSVLPLPTVPRSGQIRKDLE